jgi:hypothetical protein
MSSLPLKLLAVAMVAAFAFTSPADAAKRKHKKAADAYAKVEGKNQGTNLFRAGPLYFGEVYLGDDPDPNIRFQLWRDLSGRLGGED